MTFAVAPQPVVVDASVIVDMLLLEPRAAAAWQAWLGVERMLLAPPIVWFEVVNALVRRRKMPSETAMARVDLLFKAGLDTADRGYGGLATAADLAPTTRATSRWPSRSTRNSPRSTATSRALPWPRACRSRSSWTTDRTVSARAASVVREDRATDLVRQAQRGDMDAFEQLVTANTPAVYRLARAYAGDAGAYAVVVA